MANVEQGFQMIIDTGAIPDFVRRKLNDQGLKMVGTQMLVMLVDMVLVQKFLRP